MRQSFLENLRNRFVRYFQQIFSFQSQQDKLLRNFIKALTGFSPNELSIYQAALTHRSALDTNCVQTDYSFERLEFLGDSVLGLVVSEHFYQIFCDQQEGFLTKARSKVVSREFLNKLGQTIGLGQYIKTGREIHNLSETSIYGNALEAFIGALYLDMGFEKTKTIIVERLIKQHVSIKQLQEEESNFKSKLIEWGQKERKDIEFRLTEKIDETAQKNYYATIFVEGEKIAIGVGLSKKKAEQRASEKACTEIFK